MKYGPYILIRSFVLPLGVLTVLFVIGDVFYKDFDATARRKEQEYSSYQIEAQELANLREKNRGAINRTNAYRKILEGDQYAAVGDILREHESGTGTDILRRSGFGISSQPSVFQNISNTDRLMLDITYQGTFTSIQDAFAYLEVYKPNIFLEALRLEQRDATPSLGYMQPYVEASARYAVMSGRTTGAADDAMAGRQDPREWIPMDEALEGVEGVAP